MAGLGEARLGAARLGEARQLIITLKAKNT
jgi:hypothetical protein